MLCEKTRFFHFRFVVLVVVVVSILSDLLALVLVIIVVRPCDDHLERVPA